VNSEDILDIVAEHFLQSHDYNGISTRRLEEILAISTEELTTHLSALILDGKVELVFGHMVANPAIKADLEMTPNEQIEVLRSGVSPITYVYPSESVLESLVDMSSYGDKPYSKELVLGHAQLKTVFFDLVVLDRYLHDPRYQIQFDDYCGSIHLSDEFHDSSDIADKDKIFLQTFGLGYTEDGGRVVVVFLRYLSNLSPEHQQYWASYQRADDCEMSYEYFQNSILAEFVDHGSLFQAFIEEQSAINCMCEMMGRPPLFRKTYENRPREFSAFSLPTKKNYSDFGHLLDKMLSDNINIDFFENDIELEDRITRDDESIEVRQRGSLSLVEQWLRENIRVADDAVFDDIMTPLKEIRKARQPSAHAVLDDEYDEKYYEMQDDMILKAYKSLRLIRLLFANHPLVDSKCVPDWVYEGRIGHY